MCGCAGGVRTSMDYDAEVVCLCRLRPSSVGERIHLVDMTVVERDPSCRAEAAGPWFSRAPDVRG